METGTGTASAGTVQQMSNCVQCIRQIDAGTGIKCVECNFCFHTVCLGASSQAYANQYPQAYRCRICRVGNPLGETVLSKVYSALENLDANPMCELMALVVKRSLLVEQELHSLRSKLQAQPAPEVEMILIPQGNGSGDTPELPQHNSSKKKRALLFGDESVTTLRKLLRMQLRNNQQITVLNMQNKTGLQMLEEARRRILEHTDTTYGAFFHPGPTDCILRGNQQLLNGIADFAAWFSGHTRGHKLTVYSVPYLNNECRQLNEGLKVLAEGGSITFQKLTKAQLPMAISHATVYDGKIAENVASIAAHNLSSFLGLPKPEKVPVPRPEDNRPVKKDEAKGTQRDTKNPKHTELTSEVSRLCQSVEVVIKEFRQLSQQQAARPWHPPQGPIAPRSRQAESWRGPNFRNRPNRS